MTPWLVLLGAALVWLGGELEALRARVRRRRAARPGPLPDPSWASHGHYTGWTSGQLRRELWRTSAWHTALLDELVRREAACGVTQAEHYAQGGEHA